MTESTRPDVIILMSDQERAVPPYENELLATWRRGLSGAQWFEGNAVSFERHYTGSLACVPSRPTLFTGHYPDVHGVTQTNGLGKMADDSRMRWLREGEVPTLGHWMRAAGYDTEYHGKWHLTHSDLHDPVSGAVVRTNDSAGDVDPAAVQQYLEANPLDGFGFDGWVGPEPHGAELSDAGVRRDPIYAARAVEWLTDRYARRRAGDRAAQRPFLLVVSFVNPHDIVLFPAWARGRNPLEPSDLDPPRVPPSPTDDEDLSTKPAAQIAYRAGYPSAYGPAAAVSRLYRRNAQQYRDLYYRLIAEVDGPIDRVRRTITDEGAETVLVRTADHGELLGAHGGLHQKWFNLYDEATRVPFAVARVGARATTGRQVADMPSSHVDLVPTLLAAAGVDIDAAGAQLTEEFSEFHPLPGRNLMPVVDAEEAPDPERPVYLMTRDNMLEGDSGASGLARRFGRVDDAPLPLRIAVPEHVGSNFEGLVARVPEEVDGGQAHLWKLVRTFDDPDTWTEPGVRHLAASGPFGSTHRTSPVADQWELYDLTTDPVEAVNCARTHSAVRSHMEERMRDERVRAVPERNVEWPYATRPPTPKPVPPPVRVVRKLVQKLGLHPDDERGPSTADVTGRRALVVATNCGELASGKPTGVFASEMTVPYYAFLDAGMEVDVASPRGGLIPVDPQSLRPPIRTHEDDRYLGDEGFQAKARESLAIGDLDVERYDLVYLAGGWGAAFDLGFSDELGAAITQANAAGTIIGGVCHGPLGLLNATAADGRPLVEGRKISAVTDKQVKELGITDTPQHPEAELRAKGAVFESSTAFRDPLANHWVVDGNLVTGQNQNAGPMVARDMIDLVAARPAVESCNTHT